MPPQRRLIRRRPLLERIKAYLDPLDFLLWLSEELETSDWEQWSKTWAVPVGIAVNLAMVVARANAGGASDAHDDVFGDGSGSSVLSWFAAFVVHALSVASLANAAYSFGRTRTYRLFEASIDEAPSTPSAYRARVKSVPLASSSPLRLFARLGPSGAASRAHPDPQRDVWELGVWDPAPASLRLFCLFSPGHVVVYWLFLPAAAADPRPSVTLAKTLALAALLSAQLWALRGSFAQQARDTALVHREVLHEYDTKFVHPRTSRVMRDVGTQIGRGADGVDEGRAATIVGGGFRTNPNPNYAAHVDPDGEDETVTSRRSSGGVMTPARVRPRDLSSPAAVAATPRSVQRPAGYRASTGSGDGGHLGVFSHAASPLRKAASTTFPANQRLARVQPSPLRRESGRF